MKVLFFAGSLRSDSLNKKLLVVAERIIGKLPSCQTHSVDIRTLNIPLYDGDIEAKGIPSGVSQLGKLITESDCVVIASPEYNGSISSPLKNTIDWVSRLRPVPWDKKPILLLAASPGGMGAIRALIHAQEPFAAVGSLLYPQTFGLSKAHEAFAEDGNLKDSATSERLEKLLLQFIEFAEKN